jgi:hypothetical protein
LAHGYRQQGINTLQCIRQIGQKPYFIAHHGKGFPRRSDAISFTKKKVYELILPRGGPVDGFKIFVDPITKRIDEVVYYNEDYSLHEEVKLTDEQIAQNKLFFDYLVNG